MSGTPGGDLRISRSFSIMSSSMSSSILCGTHHQRLLAALLRDPAAAAAKAAGEPHPDDAPGPRIATWWEL
jgi:hypothetical protein